MWKQLSPPVHAQAKGRVGNSPRRTPEDGRKRGTPLFCPATRGIPAPSGNPAGPLDYMASGKSRVAQHGSSVRIPVAAGLRRLSQKSEKGQNRAMKTMIFLVPRLRLGTHIFRALPGNCLAF